MTVTLTIHRGAATVGGSCLEVATARTRLILDLGLPLFDADRQPLDSYQLRRTPTAALATGGFLPAAPGLFDDGPRPDAILLSHAHLDHTGLIDRSAADIPIYATAGASKMALAGALFANQVAMPRGRFREFKAGQSLVIGDFNITPLAVDHSIYDCVAILLEAEGKALLYSGDLRLHGRKPGMADQLFAVLKQRVLDVLIMEGTHFGLPDGEAVTEYQLEDDIVQQIRAADGLVLVSFSPQHVDRLVGFIRAAKKTGRTFVADLYSAFVLHLIASETPVPVPGSHSDLRAFYPSSLIKSAERRGFFAKLDKLFAASRIEVAEILHRPQDYLMVFRPSMMPDFAGELPPETLCLYSRWAGYLQTDEWKKLTDPAVKNPLRCVTLHTSGHILSADIGRFVETLAPRMIVPIHTFSPEEFSRRFETFAWPGMARSSKFFS